MNEEGDIATVAGLVIAANGHIPRVGDVIDVPPLRITIVEANDYRVDLVRIVKNSLPTTKRNNVTRRNQVYRCGIADIICPLCRAGGGALPASHCGNSLMGIGFA